MVHIKTVEDEKQHEFLISVIIPTYNRRDALEKTLLALEKQTLPKKYFEVIVVNDGSTDDTHEFATRYNNRGALHFTYIQKENEGQGIARNTALSHSDGLVVLFCQDDIFPAENFLEEHWKVHEKYFTENFICLGKTTWSPELEITPCMIFMEEIGMQFKYGALEKKAVCDVELGLREAPYPFFYTSNLSMKRSLFEKESFDPKFKKYGWEDIELGLRLHSKQHAMILYNERAFAYHYHHLDISDLKKRMEQVGKSAKLAVKINPELQSIIPTGVKKMLFSFIATDMVIDFLEKRAQPFFQSAKKPLPFWLKAYFYALMKKHFLKGLHA